jgi:trimethylamine monooxygenase
MTQRVCVIGAGPSGLAQLHAFEEAKKKGAQIPELVCYEKQDYWGGLWNYQWRTGLDEYGEPVHSSMYQALWSNGPKECLEFADYSFEEHFGQQIPSFPPRAVLFDYIEGRARKNDINKYIQYHHAVRFCEYDEKRDKFTVHVEDLAEGDTREEEFDYVIVANGHFSIPKVPEYPGFQDFPGRIMHSHDFRSAREFAGQHLVVMGSSYSAEDIALQCKKYGAAHVTITYRTAPMGFPWPEGIEEVPQLQKVDGNTAHFKDGSTRRCDAIILCTGYQHHFPFMEDKLRLVTSNILYPPNLYKGVFWADNPKVMYLGMQDQFYTFTLFDAEAWYARDYVLGRMSLPSKAEMQKDIEHWQQREATCQNAEDEIDFQANHLRDLVKDTDYPDFDIDLTVQQWKEWEHDKVESIIGYRNKSFVSPVTGTRAPDMATPWYQAMDDSMGTFMKDIVQPKAKSA